MPWNQLIGTPVEVRTKEWLTKKGYSLINQNWSCCEGEVDIIASLYDQLHFIVVTTKARSERGLEVEGLTRKRMQSFIQAAQHYLKRHPLWKDFKFDVLTISITKDDADFFLVKNVRTV